MRESGRTTVFPFLALGWSAILNLSAQTLVYINNGDVYIQNGAQVYIYGGIQLSGNNALLRNDGEIFIRQDPAPGTEDWINNASATAHTWTGAGLRTVYFETPLSLITGTFPTNFYNLVVRGPNAGAHDGAIVRLSGVDAYIKNQINLTHELFDVNNRTLFIDNSAPTAVNRAGGMTPPFSPSTQQGMFISTATTHALNGGFVAWQLTVGQQYYFPVGEYGSAWSATDRFRPVGIKRLGASGRMYVRFINDNPDNNDAGGTLTWCDVVRTDLNVDNAPNNLWYHVITDKTTNQANDLITIFFDDAAGEAANAILHWREDRPDAGNVTPPPNTNVPPAWSPRSFNNWNIPVSASFAVTAYAAGMDAVSDTFVFYYDAVPTPNNNNATTGPEDGSWYFTITNETDNIFPLAFIRIQATPRENTYIEVRWQVEAPLPVSEYTLERADQPEGWQPLTTIATSQTTQTYDDRNVQPATIYYYRVRARLIDGSELVSPVVQAFLTGEGAVQVAVTPMPATYYAELHMIGDLPQTLQGQTLLVQIYDTRARLVHQITWQPVGATYPPLPIPLRMLAPGNYFLHIVAPTTGTTVARLRLVKQDM